MPYGSDLRKPHESGFNMTKNIEPTAEGLDALLELPNDGPVVMLNLLRFEPGGGSKAYAQYSRDFLALLREIGGRFLFTGRAEQLLAGEGDWHYVALVEYPSRKAAVELFRSERYAKIHPNRERGLAKTVLYAVRPTEFG